MSDFTGHAPERETLMKIVDAVRAKNAFAMAHDYADAILDLALAAAGGAVVRGAGESWLDQPNAIADELAWLDRTIQEQCDTLDGDRRPDSPISIRIGQNLAHLRKIRDVVRGVSPAPQQTPTFGKIIGTCGHELTDGELDVQTIRKSQNRQGQPCVSYEANCAKCRDEMRRRGELIEPETTKGASAWLRRQRKENPHV